MVRMLVIASILFMFFMFGVLLADCHADSTRLQEGSNHCPDEKGTESCT